MNWIKTKCLLLIFVTMFFLFGCQEQDRRNVSQNVKVSETAEQMDPDQTEQAKTSQDAQTPKTEIELAEQAKLQASIEEAQGQNAASGENSESQQKLMFAQNNLELAQKGVLGYSQTVALARGIIKDYPGTEYERKARDILRQVPEDQRDRYKLTDQELGLKNGQD